MFVGFPGSPADMFAFVPLLQFLVVYHSVPMPVRLNIRSFHAHGKAHCSPVSWDASLLVFMCFTVRKERAHILRHNTPELFFPLGGAAHGRAQELSPGSAAKHCWFLHLKFGPMCLNLRSKCVYCHATPMKCCPAYLNSCPASTTTMKNPIVWEKKWRGKSAAEPGGGSCARRFLDMGGGGGVVNRCHSFGLPMECDI
jgi:hypothetical protein